VDPFELIPVSSRIKHGLHPTVNNFSGRTDNLQRLQEIFQSGENNLVAITGQGGMGKSEMVRKFSNDVYKTGEVHCLWLKGSSAKTLTSEVYDLANKLKETVHTSESKHRKLREIMEDILLKMNGRVLVIIDNVDELYTIVEELIFQCKQRDGRLVIITSRLGNVLCGAGELIKLKQLSIKDAKCVFLKSPTFKDTSGHVDTDEDLTQICNKLACFPLALQQSIAYIIQQRRVSFQRAAYGIQHYLKEYEIIARELLARPMSRLFNEYEKTAYNTWILSANKIKQW